MVVYQNKRKIVMMEPIIRKLLR